MSLSDEQMQDLARLARLDLSQDERDALRSDLDGIISYIDRLQEVDTEGVESLANITGLSSVTRADERGPLLDVDAVVSNAPERDDDTFLVPRAVER